MESWRVVESTFGQSQAKAPLKMTKSGTPKIQGTLHPTNDIVGRQNARPNAKNTHTHTHTHTQKYEILL